MLLHKVKLVSLPHGPGFLTTFQGFLKESLVNHDNAGTDGTDHNPTNHLHHHHPSQTCTEIQ